MRLVRHGFVSKAATALVAEDAGLSPQEVDVELKRLQEDYSGLRPDVPFKDVPAEPLQSVEVSARTLKTVLHALKTEAAPGPSGLSFLHIRIAAKVARHELIAALMPIVQDILNGETYTAVLSHCIIVPVPKGAGKIRGVAIGDSLRRVAAKALAWAVRARLVDVDRTLKDQYGVGEKCGLERLSDSVTRVYEEGGTVVSLDLSNAYGCLSRAFMFDVVRAYMPALMPYLSTMYRQGLLFSTSGGVIRSAEGIHQGDPLSPILFSLGIKPILDVLREAFPGWHLQAYQDDLVATTDRPLQTPGVGREANNLVEIAREKFLEVGLRLNKSKCVVAHRDVTDGNTSGGVPRRRSLNLVGVPVGSAAHAMGELAKVNSRVMQLLNAAGEMVAKEGPEATAPALIIAKYCALTKWEHFFRNVPPATGGVGNGLYEAELGFEKKEAVPAILRILSSEAEVDDDFALRLSMPVERRGLALAMPSVIL
ncbi:hypothetical protein J8273_1795 [Carpediemonas membranifera]|uniref:Reverse transcriptase domain-containing protein n=1 Tax=Carpediemonas membranifera TaxID=201153 RepID=A0A8J6BAN0_9EUKA|nr:hypothetical protein J8273_1795 [Carpediemonas membranifera]|eukprot:KAG9396764.1 hypothetical protein J8273_1795 [Carpediemonas membranifera]